MSENSPRTPEEKAIDFIIPVLQYLLSETEEVRRIVTSRAFMLEALTEKKFIGVSLRDRTIYLNADGEFLDIKPDNILPDEIFHFTATELTSRPQN